ncbi:hypothetical protein [Pararhodobacter oceanensis]|uniref:hypothetical protein n=1 Tax=Pararhodobacter oceanensis TaxID=2172121 RepID=UPI003A914559
MTFDPPLTKPQIMRLKGWERALTDASCYFAIARRHGDLMDSSQLISFATVQTRLGSAIQKGMISAAIMSACQIVMSGSKGDHVANNSSTEMDKLRDRLFDQCDSAHQWSSGDTKAVFQQVRQNHRNQLLAHWDGDKAKVSNTTPRGPGLSWRGPNPPYKGDSFVDLERAVDTLCRIISRILFNEISQNEAPEGNK